MSFGKMNTPITIVSLTGEKDPDGFVTPTETVLACVRAYKEDRNTTEKWTNRTVLQDASALFRFRYLPGLPITTDMVIECYDGRYNITAAENVRGRNLYWEIVARKEVVPRG